MVDTKILQGFEDEDLVVENMMKRCLARYFPEWQYVKNLWARRAWQEAIRRQILSRRHSSVLAGTHHKHQQKKDRRFSLGTTSALHDEAHRAIGLVGKKNTSKDKNNKNNKKNKKKVRRKKKVELHTNTTQHNVGMMFGSMRLSQRAQHMRHENEHYKNQIESTIQASVAGKEQVHKRAKEKKLDSQIRLQKRLSKRSSARNGTKIQVNQESDIVLEKQVKRDHRRARRRASIQRIGTTKQKVELDVRERVQLMKVLKEQGGMVLEESELDDLLTTQQGHDIVNNIRVFNRAKERRGLKTRRRIRND